jgi:hypothetical protein
MREPAEGWPLFAASQLILLALFLAALTGCATVRYVPVYCITKEQLAELQAQRPGKIRDKLTGKADEDLRLVTGKLVRVEAWGDGLIDVLGGCSAP